MSTSLRESGVALGGAGGGCRTIGCGVDLPLSGGTSATLLGGGSSLSSDMMLTLRSGARGAAGAGAGCCWGGGS